MTHAENNSIVPTAPKGKEIIKWCAGLSGIAWYDPLYSDAECCKNYF